MRVVGTYNGVAFVFTSDATASQENEFDPPLVVDGTTATDLTLFVDLSTWFLVDGVLVDPAQANGEQPFASQVKNNIKASIRAFEDDDRDGEDDHDEHGGDNQGTADRTGLADDAGLERADGHGQRELPHHPRGGGAGARRIAGAVESGGGARVGGWAGAGAGRRRRDGCDRP